MKFFLFLTVVTFCFFSCDKRKDVFSNSNINPIVGLDLLNSHSSLSSTIDVSSGNVTDTLKLGNDYTFSLSLADENSFLNCEFSGDGDLLLNNSAFVSGNLPTGNHTFTWNISAIGTYNFQVKIFDDYEKEVIYKFKIVVFLNRVPNTWWEVVHDGSLGPLHKKIVVHGSDQDQIYGGGIVYYQYILGSDTTLFTHSTLNYIFPSSGIYLISVKAMDNDGDWGNQIVINNYFID
jgi:hypothetical protein